MGDWIEASARVVDDDEIDRKVDHLLGKQYGLMKVFFGLASSFKGQRNVIVEIKDV